MNIHYRRILPADVKNYRAIRLESLKRFPEFFGASYEKRRELPRLPVETSIEKQAKGFLAMGAFEGDKLIGIGTFLRSNGHETRHRGEIGQMYVKPEYQGKSVGSKLLKAIIEDAFQVKGIEMITLEVSTRAASANRIYEQAGFQEFGLLKNYGKDGAIYRDIRYMVLEKP